MSSFLPTVGTVSSELEVSSTRRQGRAGADSGDSIAQPDFKKTFTTQISSLAGSRRSSESARGGDDSARSQRSAERNVDNNVENNNRRERLSNSQRRDYSEQVSQNERRVAAAREDRQSLERQSLERQTEQKNQDQKYLDRQIQDARRSDRSRSSPDKSAHDTELSNDRSNTSASGDSGQNMSANASGHAARNGAAERSPKHVDAKETEITVNDLADAAATGKTPPASLIKDTGLAELPALAALDTQNLGSSGAAQDASRLSNAGNLADSSSLVGISSVAQNGSLLSGIQSHPKTEGVAAADIDVISLGSGLSGLGSLKPTSVTAAALGGTQLSALNSATSDAGALLVDTKLTEKPGGALNKLGGSVEINSEKLLSNTGFLQGQAALNNTKGLHGLTRLSGENFSAGLAKNIDAHIGAAASLSEDASAKTQGLSAFIQTGLSGTQQLNPAARVQMPVSISFGQSGWSEMVAERSAMMAAQSIKFAELQLDPPELGQLQVKVSVNQDQASVSFVAPNAQVKDALDQTMARLKELFEQQGLNLADVDVSDQSSSQSQDDEQVAKNSHGAGDGDGDGESSDEPIADDSARVITSTYGIDHYA